ncbi:hypothetical protein NEHOM01_1121 [Nematocida homosporus]|uniref:uncharacterized protein n=1 Tax=Nematocida homosporus TaxID=1912981 RepID=UPI00221F5B01|nr:uncharacterized protein NEHOM01_1121 [Nematocida homosporus]KAI5185871.1 hypothetical protein NEHOM01_1121 [Nematocida homosporus]
MTREQKARQDLSDPPTTSTSQVIFGDKIAFIDFPTLISLDEFLRRAIIGVASSLYGSFASVSAHEIDLGEYKEFTFYLEDLTGRKIPLEGKAPEFRTILRFFSYRLTLHIYLMNTQP